MTPRSSELKMPHLGYLEGLRGVLAFYVLCHHFIAWNTQGFGPWERRFAALFQFGHSAVGFFIVLSGYSLMLPVPLSKEKTIRGGFKGYLIRRARRILPAYYAALAFSIATLLIVQFVEGKGSQSFETKDLSWTSIVSHLFLVHTWIPGRSGSINMALWSVATEWHIYFLFPLVLLPVWRRFGVFALLFVSFAIGLAPQILVPRSGHFLRHACPWYVGLFAIGMTAALITTADNDRLARRRFALPTIFVVSLAAFLILKSIQPQGDGGGPYSLQWLKDAFVGMIAWCLLCFCARDFTSGVENRRTSIVTRLLETKPAMALGRFSYSLYASHCAVLSGVTCVAAHIRLAPASALFLRVFVGIPSALLVAYFFSLWFEIPFMKRSGSVSPPALAQEEDLCGDERKSCYESITPRSP